MAGLNMLNEFWVEVAEPGELVLVQVHHEQLVRGCQLCRLGGELRIQEEHHIISFSNDASCLKATGQGSFPLLF
jgi:hypothetical protein